jgi:hypothetical protein
MNVATLKRQYTFLNFLSDEEAFSFLRHVERSARMTFMNVDEILALVQQDFDAELANA